jgi:hypothetical protein
MTRSGSRVRSLGALAATALLVAGCGSTTKTAASAKPTASATGTISGSLIARAADVSGAAKGEKVSYTLKETLPSVGKLTLTGLGSFNNSPASGQMTLHVSLPGASALGAEGALLSNLSLTLVVDKQAVYLKLPSSLAALASSFTQGKAWIELDIAKLASGGSIPGLSSLLGGQTSPTDPAATLKELAAASADGIQQVGSTGGSTVDGVATTEYRADLDLSKLSASLPASVRGAAQQQLAKAEKTLGAAKLPIDIYIDADKLIREVTFNLSTDVSGTTTPISLRMNFLSYGAQSAPVIPSASETFDASSLLKSLSSGALGSALSG